jgi:imidazolonepropionase-like amidohydrolase
MSIVRRLIVASVAVLTCGSVTAQDVTVTTGVVINGVTVVNTRDGSLTPGMAVVVDNGKIARIARAGSVQVAGTAQTIDASEKYVVPGYIDMHAHVVDAADMPTTPWPLMIANGITGFRQMSGSPELLARGQRLRQEIAAGTVVAPEPLVLVGRLFNTVAEGGRAGITTPAQAVQEVLDQKRVGTDFIKVINVSRDVFFATMEESKRQGLDVVGHLFPSVSGTDASNAGMRAYEHLGAILGNILFDCSTDETAVRRGLIAQAIARSEQPGPPPAPQIIRRILANPTISLRQGEVELIQHAIDTYSEDRCRTMAALLAKNETWQVLTLIRVKAMLMAGLPEFQNDPNLKYVAPAVRTMWREVQEIYDRTPAAWKETYRQLYEYDLKMVGLFKQAGVKIVAGDDLGGGWIVPGFGLHREFRELAKAGFSPLEVLQTATLNGAEFLRRTATMGTVEEGKNADLVLLEANPISSAENLDRIWGVVLKGRYYSKSALDKMKDDVEAAYKG